MHGHSTRLPSPATGPSPVQRLPGEATGRQVSRRMPTARSATQRVFSAGTTLFALLISLLALTGCGFATLDQMLVERGPAAELRSGGEVEVIREGKAIPAEVGMILKKEDVIQTGAGTSAAIGFMLAGEIILRPETRIKILNPSIFEFSAKSSSA